MSHNISIQSKSTKSAGLKSSNQKTEKNVWQMFWQGYLKVTFFSNVNRMYVQSNLVFNNILKTLAQKQYLYIVYYLFLKHFSRKMV